MQSRGRCLHSECSEGAVHSCGRHFWRSRGTVRYLEGWVWGVADHRGSLRLERPACCLSYTA
eukprot:2528542-Alexandrium_andersonii.AAC.1